MRVHIKSPHRQAKSILTEPALSSFPHLLPSKISNSSAKLLMRTLARLPICCCYCCCCCRGVCRRLKPKVSNSSAQRLQDPCGAPPHKVIPARPLTLHPRKAPQLLLNSAGSQPSASACLISLSKAAGAEGASSASSASADLIRFKPCNQQQPQQHKQPEYL